MGLGESQGRCGTASLDFSETWFLLPTRIEPKKDSKKRHLRAALFAARNIEKN
jgi:hypothetical protein